METPKPERTLTLDELKPGTLLHSLASASVRMNGEYLATVDGVRTRIIAEEVGRGE